MPNSDPNEDDSMTHGLLSRIAAPIAIGAGVMVVVTRIGTVVIVPFGDPGGLRAAVVSPAYAVIGVASVVAYALLVLAALAIYQRAAPRAGWLGVIGVCAAIIGTVFMAGDWWYEAFALPWLAAVAPQVFETGLGGSILAGAASSFALFSIGWVVYGVALLRARVFPTAIAIGIVVGGLVSGTAHVPIAATYLVGGAILGAAITWLGVWLTTATGVEEGEPVRRSQ